MKIDSKKIGRSVPMNPVAPPTNGPVIAVRIGMPPVNATKIAQRGATYITDRPLKQRKISTPNAITIHIIPTADNIILPPDKVNTRLINCMV
jgi:hypothetical protein